MKTADLPFPVMQAAGQVTTLYPTAERANDRLVFLTQTISRDDLAICQNRDGKFLVAYIDREDEYCIFC